MNNSIITLFAVLFIFASCGEDRTYEYEEKTQGNHHMQALMQEWYLWGDSLKELDWKQYFATPTAFMPRLTAQSPVNDSWSYCAIDTIVADHHACGYFDHYNSYGIDITLMTDPTGETTKQYARVLTVYPASPASECGLQRGDFIAEIDNVKMSKTVMSQLVNGRARTLIVSHLGIDNEDMLYWESDDTLHIGASRTVAVATVMQCKMLNNETAYIMLTDLDDFESIKPSLSNLLSRVPAKFIVDLRLCNRGTIECAVQVARMIGNANGTMLRTQWNKHKSANDSSYDIDVTNRHSLYFITSGYTQGAAEWLVYGLRSVQHSGLMVVGQSTAGQNVMLYPVPSPYYYTLYPAVAYVANGAGYYDYGLGIVPDDIIDEFDYVHLYPYGDVRETLVNHIIMQ